MRKLAHKRQAGHVSEAGLAAKQPAFAQMHFQNLQPARCFHAMCQRECWYTIACFVEISVRVFVAVQGVFKHAIIARNQCQRVLHQALLKP